MKKLCLFFQATLSLLVQDLHGQGTFVYDQQTSTESLPGEAARGIQVSQPIGQSFTPLLSSVGFIRLQLFDINPGNGQGVMMSVNIRTNSIAGPILASSDTVSLVDGFPGNNTVGFVNFFFTSPPAISPGLTYYFQPVVQSGDAWAIGRFVLPNYPGGTEYINGQAGINDLWFREGIYVVPEPAGLALVACGIVMCGLRRGMKRRNPCDS